MSPWLVPLLPPLLCTGFLLQDAGTEAVSADRQAERQVVLRVLEVYTGEDAEDQERALRSIDPTPLASFVDLLAEGCIPADWSASAGEAGDAGGSQARLEPQTISALRGALRRVTVGELRPFFETVVVEEPRVDRREVCVAALTDVGEKCDLKLVIRLATPADQHVRVLPRSLRKAYEGALSAILARNPDGLGYLQGAFGAIHTGLSSATIDAIGGVPPEQALTTLVAVLGAVRELDAYILAGIAKLGSSVRRPVTEDVRSRIRTYLTHADPAVVRAAVRASGSLEDYEALPQLLEMLSHDDENLRTSAHVALGSITGLPFRADVRMWRAWYGSESEWWRVESRKYFNDLEERDELLVSSAINEITRQRLFRHERANVLLPVLGRDETELVVLACRSLAQVGSREAVPGLVASLEHPDWNVRRAAWSALVRITGMELPPESKAWRSELKVGEQ